MQSQLLRQEELRRTHFSFAMRLGVPSTCSVRGPVSYLGGIRDLWVMGLVNKEMSIICRKPAVLKKLISRNWMRLMKSTRTGIDPEEFSTLLQSHQCVVAGAFALQSVTGVNFGTSRNNGPNMQVYCTTAGYKEVLHYLENRGYIPQRLLNKTIAECTHSPMCHRRTRHSVDLVRMCQNLLPKNAVAQFDYSYVLMVNRDNEWFNPHIFARIMFSSEVPLCYAFIM
jgi:hypothetical protein